MTGTMKMTAPLETTTTTPSSTNMGLNTSLHEESVPLLQPVDDSDSDSEESDQGSEKSTQSYQRREAMDAIEEAWDANSDIFTLRMVHLDRFAIGMLLQKWDELCLMRQTQCFADDKTIRKIVLDRCSFTAGFAVQLMVIFMNKLGDELKELVITDGCVDAPEVMGNSPLGALLGGMGNIRSLESLILEKADLRGKLTGHFLRCILANNPNLEVLQLYGCRIDDGMYEELLDGLKNHFELRYLDVGGLNLNDGQLGNLVDALVHGGQDRKLQFLDISGSSIGLHSLRSLSSLVYQCFSVQELVLCSCTYTDLFEFHDEEDDQAKAPQEEEANKNKSTGQEEQTPKEDASTSLSAASQEAYKEFVDSLHSVLSLTNQSLRLIYCDLASPLLKALGSNSDLMISHDGENGARVAASTLADNHTHSMPHQPPRRQYSITKSSDCRPNEYAAADSMMDSCFSFMICL